jgi:nitric oxide reductase subunit B
MGERARLAPRRQWFWIGHQGWEYLDLGRLWQVLLVVGLFLWVFILWRGLRDRLREAHGNLPWLLFHAALAIPAFYAVGLLTRPRRGFVISDFWRFWVVHLWVDNFLELFTTVVVAYMFVLLGMVREATAIRVIYLDVILSRARACRARSVSAREGRAGRIRTRPSAARCRAGHRFSPT